MSYTLPTGKSLCMFTLAANMYDHNGLLWPSSGSFAAPNYIPTRYAGWRWAKATKNRLMRSPEATEAARNKPVMWIITQCGEWCKPAPWGRGKV